MEARHVENLYIPKLQEKTEAAIRDLGTVAFKAGGTSCCPFCLSNTKHSKKVMQGDTIRCGVCLAEGIADKYTDSLAEWEKVHAIGTQYGY